LYLYTRLLYKQSKIFSFSLFHSKERQQKVNKTVTKL